MKKFNFYLVLIIIFFTSQFSFSQVDSASNKFYKLSEIPTEIENATIFINEANQKLLSSSIISKATKDMESVNRRFLKLKLISDSLDIENSNIIQIQDLQRRWIALRKKIEETLSTISNRIIELEGENVIFQDMQTTWELTSKQNTEIEIPKELLSSIKLLGKEIENTIQNIEKETGDLISIQLAFTSKNLELKTNLKNLENIILGKQRAIFDRNSDPLWEQFSDSTESNSIAKQAELLIFSYSKYIESFYSYYKRKFSIGIFIFILFLIFTLGLKYYGNKIEDDDPIIHKAILLFSKPISISFLLFLLFLSFTTDSTIAFQGIRRVLMLIPLLFILLKIVDSRLKSTLYIFMFLFFINELRVSSGNDNILEHLILIGLTFLTIFAIFWVKKLNFKEPFFKDAKTLNLVKLSFKISFVLMAFVLLLNILGFVTLSNILFNGFHNSAYATILFLTANLVFNAIILIVLKTKPMQKLQIVLHHSNKIILNTRKFIKISLSIAWVAIILNSFSLYDFIYTEIMKLLSTNIGYGSISISVSGIILFMLTIWISFKISRFILFILDIDILPQMELPRGVPGTITSISKYIILSVGFLFALVSIGIDFNKFALLFGALGVGIGFGLQSLVNNFLSGIILIFEHPIQIGDIIKVGDVAGTVKKIGIRASIVKSFDGSEIVVPNGNLISTELTNWTLSDKNRRIDVNVGVKYGSDVKKVEELLLKCANDNKKILEEPAPIVLFQNFGNSSLDFTLRCWAENIDNWYLSQSELRFAINQIFEENDITIPFPQSDVYIKEFAKHEKQNPHEIDEEK